jgi:hypothetical protein
MLFSQIGQDEFVIEVLKGKKYGTFLDVGCADYKNISNTFYLEKELGWRGIGIDLVEVNKPGWDANRPNSTFLLEDATKLDYGKLLLDYNFGFFIDYLSIDLEPPHITLRALKRIFESDITFQVITFEHDAHRGEEVQKESREFLKTKGYRLVKTVVQDDFYVHESIKLD